MREGHVNNAVSFLTNPSVQDASESQRVQFLRSKGLTQEEIDEAYNRANESAPADNKTNTLAAGTAGPGNTNNNNDNGLDSNEGRMQQQQQQQQQPRYRQPPVEQPMWARYLIPGTLALSASAGLAFLYRTMVLHERNGGNGPPFGQFGSFMGFGGPPGMQPPPPHLQQNTIPNGMPNQQLALPGSPPQNNPNMYGQAPYGMPGAVPPPPSASAAAAGQEATTTGTTGTAQTQLVPKAANSVAPGLTPLPQGQLDRLAKAMEKQTEMTTKVCETVQEVMKASAKQQEEHIAASASKDAALLKALLASQSTQAATNEIRVELASIKALVLSTLKGDMSSSELAQAVSASPDAAAKVDTGAVSTPVETAADNADGAQATGDISSSETAAGSGATAAAVGDASTDVVVEETDTNQNEHQVTKDKHIKASREALAKMCVGAENKADLAKGLNMLLMYIRNLRKDPDVPRFRRIAKQNSNYKKSLESVKGHVEFLQSLGFVERSGGYAGRNAGGVLEWSEEWLSSAADWANDVLDDAITNLEAAKKDVNETNSPARENPAADAATLPASNVSAPSPAVSQSSSAMQAAHAVISGGGEETKSNSDATPDVPLSTGEEAAAAQPMSYVDVMKMVQEGKTPPGVKQIPNKLSADANELAGQATSTPPPKPWETTTADDAQASDVVVDAD